MSCPAFPFAQWKVLIIRDLLTGTKRFSELKKSVQGISQKVLTSHLRDMESDGLVDRKIYAQVPPRVEYSLTELGLTLKPVLDACRRRSPQIMISVFSILKMTTHTLKSFF